MLSPYKMAKFAKSLPSLAALIMAYEDINPAQRAAAEAIFGGIDVSGVLPVNLRGIAACGSGIRLSKSRLGFTSPVAENMEPWLTDSLNTVLTKALKAGAFPGCQVLVARNGNVVYDRSFGRLSSVPTSAKVNDLTAYDLASVSKATGTLSGIMKIYDNPDYAITIITKEGERILYDIDQIQTNDKQTKSGVIDEFVGAVLENRKSLVEGSDVLNAMRAVFASLASSEKGMTVAVVPGGEV